MSQSAGSIDRRPEDAMKSLSEIETMMFDMARSSPAMRMMPPLMAHPTAAAAAATAIGMGAASQMVGFFVGSMQGAFDASRRMGAPFSPFDMTATLKAFDTEWVARVGDAALDTAEDARRTVGDVARRVAVEVEKDITEAPAKSAKLAKKGEEAAAAMVAATADALEKTTRTVAKQAEAAGRQAEHVTKRVLAEPVRAAARATEAAANAPKPAPAVRAKAPQAKAPQAKEVPQAKKASPVEKAPKAKEAGSPVKAARAPAAATAPRKTEKPGAPDDLKQISGIGPKLEEVLNRLGVWSYPQIAEWSPGEVSWLDDYLQARGRIERDDWIGQAAALSGKK